MPEPVTYALLRRKMQRCPQLIAGIGKANASHNRVRSAQGSAARQRVSSCHGQADRHNPGPNHIDLRGSASAEIDDPATAEWSAVVDDHIDASPILEVGDPHLRAERQRPMGGGHPVGVHAVAIGGP